MADDPQKLAAFVHQAVSTADDYVGALDHILATSEDKYEVSRELLGAIRYIMYTGARLNKKLYEENQQILDLIDEAIKKNKK